MFVQFSPFVSILPSNFESPERTKYKNVPLPIVRETRNLVKIAPPLFEFKNEETKKSQRVTLALEGVNSS